MKPGERIKELRITKDKNQKEFGEIIGYSDAYLSEIERGVKEPSMEFLKALEEKFDVSPAYILYGISKSRWDTIKRYFQSEEVPEESIQKLGSLLYSPEGDHQSGAVRQPEGEYLPTSTKKVLDNVKKILESGNETMIDALKANIKAFLEIVESKRYNSNKGD
jgi:transcriptional regulator with XRE-family HTH domain